MLLSHTEKSSGSLRCPSGPLSTLPSILPSLISSCHANLDVPQPRQPLLTWPSLFSVCSFGPSKKQMPRDYKSKKYIEGKCGEGLTGWKRRRWKGLGPHCWSDTCEEEGQETFRLHRTPKDASSRQRGVFAPQVPTGVSPSHGIVLSYHPYPGLFFSREFLFITYYRITFFLLSLLPLECKLHEDRDLSGVFFVLPYFQLLE